MTLIVIVIVASAKITKIIAKGYSGTTGVGEGEELGEELGLSETEVDGIGDGDGLGEGVGVRSEATRAIL